MNADLIRLCRACGNKKHVFCNVGHDVITKLLKFAPGLIEVEETKLPPDICIDCFQMIKTIVFNIEGIADMQTILKIRLELPTTLSPAKNTFLPPPSTSTQSNKRSLADETITDMTKKYTNIKFRKIAPTPSNGQNIDESLVKSSHRVYEKQTPKISEKKTSTVKKSDTTESTGVQKSFMCISCSEKFHQFNELESHLKTCKSRATQQFKCFCGKVLPSRSELAVHVSVVHKQNKQQHVCSTCQKHFSSLANLQNHVTTTHKSPLSKDIKILSVKRSEVGGSSLGKGSFMCHICDERFGDSPSLQKHRSSSSCKAKPKKQIET